MAIGRPRLNGMPELRAIPIRGIPEIRSGDQLVERILIALKRSKLALQTSDILVLKHKIVSKAEDRIIKLAGIKPSARARRWAEPYALDPRVVQLALAESRRIVRKKRGILITETNHGFICANSGVDLSNVDGGESAVLLPVDPDRSAAVLHRALGRKTGIFIPVIIADSFGRPWREGLCEVAIGVAGMKVFRDYRGQRDPYGYHLRVTQEAIADELAGMAGLVCDKLARTPACIIRGFNYPKGRGRARDLIRPATMDLFR